LSFARSTTGCARYDIRIEVSRYDELVRALEAEIPGFRIVRKDHSRLQRAIHWSLVVVTFGGMRAYLDCYQTTIGRTVYVTPDWDERDELERYVTLRHEAVHLRQFRRFGLPLMSFLYLIPIFPIGLAWGRARLEWAGYAETIRATAEVRGVEAARDPKLHAYVIRQFTGPAYGWMWPFAGTIRAWIDHLLSELELEHPGSDH
jgi:hypothetical protein